MALRVAAAMSRRFATARVFGPVASARLVSRPHPVAMRALATASAVIVFDENTQKLDSLTAGNAITYYTASWCGPCKMIAPKFAELAAKFTGIKFIKIDVDENEAAAGTAGITAVPTFCVYQGGKVVRKFSGADTASLTAACEELSK